MRIIFIPGMGEDERIFSKIAPQIQGEKLILNSWKLLPDSPIKDINVLAFARTFITKYNITQQDVLIGHSMGGWIAYHVKHLVQCRVIQIASMTNTNRVQAPVFNHPIVYWAIKNGVAFNSFTKWLLTILEYSHKSSKEIYLYVIDLLEKGNKDNVNNQLRLILNPVPKAIKVQPDLRIHARRDTILKPPVEPYHEVPGDHFSLYTYPEQVLLPIVDFLQNC